MMTAVTAVSLLFIGAVSAMGWVVIWTALAGSLKRNAI